MFLCFYVFIGWKFDKSEKPARGCTRDPIFDSSLLKELYLKANSHYEGRFTVPMLWDKQSATIVNNESADIMCMFNDEFNELSSSSNMINLRPDNFVDQIKKAQSWFMENFTGPVFQAGYAQSQKEYEEHAKQVAVSLEAIEKKLGESKFYHGDTITETDLTMFAFLIRFDPVFFVLFKCNLLAINNCPSIKRWMKSILEMPGIAQVIDMEHIKKSSYQGNKQLNPNGIVPLGNGPKELASLYDKGSINQENH